MWHVYSVHGPHTHTRSLRQRSIKVYLISIDRTPRSCESPANEPHSHIHHHKLIYGLALAIRSSQRQPNLLLSLSLSFVLHDSHWIVISSRQRSIGALRSRQSFLIKCAVFGLVCISSVWTSVQNQSPNWVCLAKAIVCFSLQRSLCIHKSIKSQVTLVFGNSCFQQIQKFRETKKKWL